MSRADVGRIWGRGLGSLVWNGNSQVPGQKYEVTYVQLKRQPRLKYTASSCPKKECADPRNMSSNKGDALWGGGWGYEEGSSCMTSNWRCTYMYKEGNKHSDISCILELCMLRKNPEVKVPPFEFYGLGIWCKRCRIFRIRQMDFYAAYPCR